MKKSGMMIAFFKYSIAKPSLFIPVLVDTETEIAEFIVIDPNSNVATDVRACISNGRVDHHLLKDGLYVQHFPNGPVMKVLNSILDTSGLELFPAQNGTVREICQEPISKISMNRKKTKKLPTQHVDLTVFQDDEEDNNEPHNNDPNICTLASIVTPQTADRTDLTQSSPRSKKADFCHNLEETSMQLLPLIEASDADPYSGLYVPNSQIESRTILQRLVQTLGIQHNDALHIPGMEVTAIPTTVDFSVVATKIANIAQDEVSDRILNIAFSKCNIENIFQSGVVATMKEIVLFLHIAQISSIESSRYPFLLDNESHLFVCHPIARSFQRDLSLVETCRMFNRCCNMMIAASEVPSPPMNMAMFIRMDNKIHAMKGYLLSCLNGAMWSQMHYEKYPFNFASTVEVIVAGIESIRRGNCETSGLSADSTHLLEGILSYIFHEDVGYVKRVPIFVFKDTAGATIPWIIHPTVVL